MSMVIDLKHIAKLANIPLKDEEAEKLKKELEETIEHIQRLNEIDTSKVSGTNTVTNCENVTREDLSSPSLPREKIIYQVATHNGLFVVPAIFDEE